MAPDLPGLAAAQQLNRAGHLVTVIEKSDRIGGLLRYGIPDFKMEKWLIDRRLEQLQAEGIEFRTGVHVGIESRSELNCESTLMRCCLPAAPNSLGTCRFPAAS